MFDLDPRDDVDEDARADARAQRRQWARASHWCTLCLGHTGPGSPCYVGPEPAGDTED